MKQFRLFYFLLALLPALPLSAGNQDFSNLHLGMPSRAQSPYALGFTAFGVEDAQIQTGELQFSPTYSFFNGYPKTSPDNGKDIYRFQLSDISDPYQGFFYKLNAGGNPLLLHVNVNYSRVDENHKDGSINIGEGRLDASTRIGDFYLGVMGIYQRIVDDISVSGWNGALMELEQNKISDSNFYYQLSLGYKLSSTSFIGLQYDNIFNLSTNRDSVISFHDELFSTHFSPFLAAPTLMSSIYRFNATGKQNYWYTTRTSDNMNYLMERLEKLTTHHFSMIFTKKMSTLNIFASLEYYSLNFSSELNTDFGGTVSYSNSGNFNNLFFDIYIKDIGLYESKNKNLYLSFHLQQILYSNLNKNYVDVSGNNVGTKQDISFSRSLIEMITSFTKTNALSLKFFIRILNSSFFYNQYYYTGTNYMPVFREVYPFADNPIDTVEGKGKDSMSFQTGLANRVYLSDALTFDLGAAFYQIDYDAKNTLKTNILSVSTGLNYALTPDAHLGLSYQRVMYLTYEVQENSYKATQSQFGLDVQMKF